MCAVVFSEWLAVFVIIMQLNILTSTLQRNMMVSVAVAKTSNVSKRNVMLVDPDMWLSTAGI